MNLNNGITNKALQQAQVSEDHFRKMPQRLAKAHMYIKDNNLDIKISPIHDQLLLEGKDVKKNSEHLNKILEILNEGRITKKPW